MKHSHLLLSTFLFTGAAHADVTPHPLFCDHAVLQRGAKVPVWGFSNKEGEAGDSQVAGANKQFKPATAAIESGKLIVSSPEVAALRYCFYGIVPGVNPGSSVPDLH